jgi:hypothetical protein
MISASRAIINPAPASVLGTKGELSPTAFSLRPLHRG